MSKPDMSFTPKAGEPVEVSLDARERPWHLRLGNVDLFITVNASPVGEPPVGPEDVDLDHLDPEGVPE